MEIESAENNDSFTESSVDLLDMPISESDEEEVEDEKTESDNCDECEDKEECGDVEPTEECNEKKSSSKKSTGVKYDKDNDIKNMTPEQIRASMDPGIRAKLESAGILDQYLEAISIAGDNNQTQPDMNALGDTSELDNAVNNLGTDNSVPSADDGNTTPVDNTVTAAVKDKVEEMNSTPDQNGDEQKQALLKKAISLSKGLEDLKNQIINFNKV